MPPQALIKGHTKLLIYGVPQPPAANTSTHQGATREPRQPVLGRTARGCLLCQVPLPHLPPLLMLCTPGSGPDPALVPSLSFCLLPRHKNRRGWQLQRSKDVGSKEMAQAKMTQTALRSQGRGDGSSTGGTPLTHTDAAVLPSRKN